MTANYNCELRVVPTHNRMAFDIIDGPDYETRHTATAVFVRYRNLCKEGRILTYVNDSRPFGPTIRHANNISEGFIRLLDLTAGQKYPAVFSILPDGAHQFEILNIE